MHVGAATALIGESLKALELKELAQVLRSLQTALRTRNSKPLDQCGGRGGERRGPNKLDLAKSAPVKAETDVSEWTSRSYRDTPGVGGVGKGRQGAGGGGGGGWGSGAERGVYK